MEREPLRPIEANIRKPIYDAALVHSYWYSQRGDETPVQLSLRSHMAARAAADLYNNAVIGKVVVAIGKLWGEEYPSEAKLMRDILVRKYDIPERDILVSEEATDTDGEVEKVLELAQVNGWNRILDIASNQHFQTIPGIFKKQARKRENMPQVGFISSEAILLSDKSEENSRVRKLVGKILESDIEKGHYRYERIKSTADLIGASFLLKKLSKKRTKKGPVFFGDKFGFPMDQYGLVYNPEEARERKEQGYHYSEAHAEALKEKPLKGEVSVDYDHETGEFTVHYLYDDNNDKLFRAQYNEFGKLLRVSTIDLNLEYGPVTADFDVSDIRKVPGCSLSRTKIEQIDISEAPDVPATKYRQYRTAAGIYALSIKEPNTNKINRFFISFDADPNILSEYIGTDHSKDKKLRDALQIGYEEFAVA